MPATTKHSKSMVVPTTTEHNRSVVAPSCQVSSLFLLPKWHFLVKPFTSDASDIKLWMLVNYLQLVIVVRDVLKAFDLDKRYGKLEELWFLLFFWLIEITCNYVFGLFNFVSWNCNSGIKLMWLQFLVYVPIDSNFNYKIKDFDMVIETKGIKSFYSLA